jgi:hypothetical protein
MMWCHIETVGEVDDTERRPLYVACTRARLLADHQRGGLNDVRAAR